MRRYEEFYKIDAADVVLLKENFVHEDIDLRLDGLEKNQASIDGSAEEVIARATNYVANALTPIMVELDQRLADYREGVPAASVVETSDRRFSSDAERAALAAKAPLASPALTGAPTAPTAAAGTNTAQIATTAFVRAAIAALAGAAPAVLDTIAELERHPLILKRPSRFRIRLPRCSSGTRLR